METQIKYTGADEVFAKLDMLGDQKAARRVVTKSVRAAINVWRKAARANAKKFDRPESPNQIYKNVVSSVSTSRSGAVIGRVGVKGGAKQYVDTKRNQRKGLAGTSYTDYGKVFYWRYLEFGLAPGTRKVKTKNGNRYSYDHPGFAATPFLRPVINSKAQEATDVFAKRAIKELDIELKKLER